MVKKKANVKRIFLIVLDSCGAGELPDAGDYGDAGANTLRSLSKTGILDIPNLKRLGIGNIAGLEFLGTAEKPEAAMCKLAELSKGKDTTVGHWEIAGVISEKPFPTYPDGFPEELIKELERLTGRGILCNKPYSGTEVIKDYGKEHIATGKLIVYTSADSVMQIAAHEEVVPLDELYRCCETARRIMRGEHSVGRVIARPFTGFWPYVRTPGRHDYSLEPTGKTVLDALFEKGREVISVGKIYDIFTGRGITKALKAKNNKEAMAAIEEAAGQDFHGLCFANLVDFDMVYGHRNDADGYARALNEFDAWLGEFLKVLQKDDIVMITADHGCDPGNISTDHTREYVPLLIFGNAVNIKPVNLGIRSSFSDISATISDLLDAGFASPGKSFAEDITEY